MGYRPHRYPTMFPVELLQGTKVQKCFMINVTSTGAGLFEVTDLSPKDDVKLRCSVGTLAATIQWTDDDQCGLIFHQRIGARQLAQFRHAPTTFGRRNGSVQTFTELR